MKFPLLTTTLSLAFAMLAPVSASVINIDFDAAADLEGNFWGGSTRTATTWNSGGYLAKTAGSATTGLVYNSNSTGATANQAGSVGGTPLDTFNHFTIQLDVSAAGLAGGNSVGFYAKVNEASNSGYVALFRLSDSGSTPQADLRIWSGANPSTAGVGSLLTTQTFAPTAGNFSANTFYTVKLDVEDVGSDVKFTASIWSTAGTPTQIGSTITFTHLNGVTGDGQVGLRLASTNHAISVDNFAITAIPEPSTYAFVGGVAALGLALVQRRKRR